MRKFERKEKSQPKHKPTASSGASRAPRPPPVQQPGWKGPTYIHKKAARPKQSSAVVGPGPTLQPQVLPVDLQQLVLNVFRDVFPASIDFEGLKPILQEINTALSKRDLTTAFGTEEFREAYAIRWAPSRALCYANLLASILSAEAAEEPWVTYLLGNGSEIKRPARAVCFGGGAAEVMAFGALLRHLKPEARGKPTSVVDAESSSDQVSSKAVEELLEGNGNVPPLQIKLVDTTSWECVVAKLEQGLITPPVLSKYASATARANNAPLVAANAMATTVAKANLLASGVEALRSWIGVDASLITFFFTLNELYTASIAKTTKLLVELTLTAPKHSLMLIVDSPGCYVETTTETTVGKRYSMAWLMDHLLLDKGKKKVGEDDEDQKDGNDSAWEKLVGDECRLFRIEERLDHPASLENKKFQVHLFRRL